jgi:TonB family protein
VRAGDGRLLLTALLLLCAAPWNAALWWEWRRLRQAVETDCDRRVLRSQPDVRRYGTLLLEVANRTRRHALPMAAFAEPRSFLERRLRMMTNREARNRAGWIAALAGALVLTPALLLALPAPRPVGVAGVKALFGRTAQPEYRARVTPTFAVMVPSVDTVPVTSTRSSGERGGFQELIPPRDTVPETPEFTYQVARLDRKPALLNENWMKGVMERFYPNELRSAGVGGMAMIQFVIDTDGTVDPTTLKSVSASDPQFATASILVAERFLFRPGEHNGKPVRVMIQMPISWQPSADGAPGSQDQSPPAGVVDGPAVEPRTNADLAAALELIRTKYPQLLESTPAANTTLGIVALQDGSIVSSHLAASGRLAVDEAGLASAEIDHLMVVKASPGKVPVDVIWMTRK